MIEERVADDYEACYWIIGVEEYKYRDDTNAYIEVSLEKFENVEVHIYDGTGIGNATEFIQSNATAVVGAPYRAPISTNLILVASTAPQGKVGSLSFSYQLLDAEEYHWAFRPFVKLESWIWYLILFSAITSPFILCVTCCCCCRHSVCFYNCCDCCVCSDCCRPKSKRMVKPMTFFSNR